MTLPVLGLFGPPGRMVAIFLAGVLAVLVAVVATEQYVPTTPQPPPAPPTISPPTSSASPSVDPQAGDYQHDQDALDDEKPQWEPAVLGFGKNFTNTQDRNAATWRDRLTSYVAPAVRDQLVDVDPTKIPTGRYDGYELLETGNCQIKVKINYQGGWALVLYVTSDGHGWKVAAYDKWEE